MSEEKERVGETRESKRARVAGSASAVATTIGYLGIDLLIIMRDCIVQDNQGRAASLIIQ